jgi:hypothetical protein
VQHIVSKLKQFTQHLLFEATNDAMDLRYTTQHSNSAIQALFIQRASLTLPRFIALSWQPYLLESGAEERQDGPCPPPGPLAHLPLLHEDLLQPPAARDDGRHPGAGDPPAVDHLAGLQLQAPSHKVAQADVGDLRAVGERDLSQLRTAVAYLRKRYVTYDLHACVVCRSKMTKKKVYPISIAG